MLEEAKQLANLIEVSLPKKFEIGALSLNSKIPFKASALRELLAYRVSELALKWTPSSRQLFNNLRYMYFEPVYPVGDRLKSVGELWATAFLLSIVHPHVSA